MRTVAWAGLALVLLPIGVLAVPPSEELLKKDGVVISSGKTVTLTDFLTPEKPTLFIFYKPSSSLERDFVKNLQTQANGNVGIQRVELKTGSEPITKKYAVTETPTALVYDRRGRLLAQSSQSEEIIAALKKAAGVMRLDWAEEGDANFVASVKGMGRLPGTGILRTMTLQPEYLRLINELSLKAHFSDGHLNRRTKEMIATYVSALNRCKY